MTPASAKADVRFTRDGSGIFMLLRLTFTKDTCIFKYHIKREKMLNITIEEIKLASKIVKNKNLPRCIKALNNEEDYNCWGFTAWSLKLVKKLYWISNAAMEEILKTHTVKTLKPVPGDIIVYRADWFDMKRYLMHTAIVTDLKNNQMVHKDGSDPLELNDIRNTIYTGNPRYKNAKITYRKVKK